MVYIGQVVFKGTVNDSFPDLPIELVLKILSFAAYSSRQSALAICLTATWTLPIALPALYQTVTLKSRDALNKFLATLAGSSPKAITNDDSSLTDDVLTAISGIGSPTNDRDIGLHVKHLLVPSSYATEEELRQCMSTCPYIEDLAIRNDQVLRLIAIVGEPDLRQMCRREERKSLGFKFVTHLKRLTVFDNAHLHILARISGGMPSLILFYANLTHLVLINALRDQMHTLPLILRTFPNLSHIVLPFNMHRSPIDILSSLESTKRLLNDEKVRVKMLVLHVTKSEEVVLERGEDWRSTPSAINLILDANRRDERLYILPINDMYVHETWERGARGGKSFWDEAVEVLQETKKAQGVLAEGS